MRSLFFTVIFLVFGLSSVAVFSQCPQGAIGVSGAGCGCEAGCNLTSFGGPNCSPVVTGNCSAGYVAMQVDIIVPAGCTFTVTAVMQSRPGCTAAGADGNCATCDRLKVDIPGGPKPVQFGGGNSSITDTYTLAGPATIRVSGGANRADEIITYSTTFSGAFCDACGSILPVELLNFSGQQEERTIGLDWVTASEINSDYFLLERSVDGKIYELIASINAAGNSSSTLNYKFYDTQPPLAKIIYYRLRQFDNDGAESPVQQIAVDYDPQLISYSNELLTINLAGASQEVHIIEIYDLQGAKVESHYLNNSFEQIPWTRKGFWIVRFPELDWSEKIIVF